VKVLSLRGSDRFIQCWLAAERDFLAARTGRLGKPR
jgi:hypothetical protein